ncbi:hypothetical protein [Burkholderia sp. Bp9143]|nr:hypothetical protein [Burkholderia sp. Bp9143]
MKTPSVLGAACADVVLTISMPVIAHGIGKTVTPGLERAVLNIPVRNQV